MENFTQNTNGFTSQRENVVYCPLIIIFQITNVHTHLLHFWDSSEDFTHSLVK